MIHGNLEGLEEGRKIDEKTVIERFFGLCGAEVSSYCGDKEQFLGRYHDYGNPVGVENGKLDNELNYNGNGCGALSADILLQPGETTTIAFVLGMSMIRKRLPSWADTRIRRLPVRRNWRN